jgi:hypothetical protein
MKIKYTEAQLTANPIIASRHFINIIESESFFGNFYYFLFIFIYFSIYKGLSAQIQAIQGL